MAVAEIVELFSDEKFKFLNRSEAERYEGAELHASHILVYANTGDRLIFEEDKVSALALVLTRHDGYFGFPGGFVDPGETWEEAANRELNEEIHFDLNKNRVDANHYVYSSLDSAHNWILHFYALPISIDDFVQMEMNIHKAYHYGVETLGFSRVPYYITRKGRGLPSFLRHQYIGNAKQQLIVGSIATGIVDKKLMAEAIEIGAK